jgi:TATA-binding protein-associated factor
MTPAWAPQNPTTPGMNNSPPQPPAEFPVFDVPQLLRTSTLLLASSGKEYEAPALTTPAEVARARKEAMSRLGLGGFLDSVGGDDLDLDLGKELSQSETKPMDMDLDKSTPLDMDLDEPKPSLTPFSMSSGDAGDTSGASSPAVGAIDLRPSGTRAIRIKTEGLELSEPLASASSPVDGTGLSARERNRLKRKLKSGVSAFVAPSQAPSTPQSTVPTSAPNKCVRCLCPGNPISLTMHRLQSAHRQH